MKRWCMPVGPRFLLLVLLLPWLNLAQAVNQATAMVGVWTTQDGKARVQIVEQGSRFKGQIVWLKEPLFPDNDPRGMAGKPKVDRNNPDGHLRTRAILGLPLLEGFHYAGDDVWSGGTIYDPESGKTYSCSINLTKDGSLRIRGYVGIPLFGRTEIWKRYHPDAAVTTASASTRIP